MFENWKNFEGTYVNPIVLKARMTTLEEVRQSVREKNPEVNEAILERLAIVEVKYLSKDNQVYLGQIVIDKDLAKDIARLFEYIEEINNHTNEESEKFFIDKIIPISNKLYEGNDEKSMRDNNTSAFNFRQIKDTNRLSTHSFAFSFDINPRDNPVIGEDGKIQPSNGKYDERNPNNFTLQQNQTPGNKILNFLRQSGFEWDGPYKDFHHFQKVLPTREFVRYYKENEITREDIKPASIENCIQRLILNSVSMENTPEGLKNIKSLIEKNEELIRKIGMEKYLKFLNEVNERIHHEQIRS